MSRPLILVTNDDGIESPGLAAAAAALDPLGDLLVVAPTVQQTSMSRSRSYQGMNDGRLFRRTVRYGSQSWEGVAANASPALTVEHALLEIAPRRPALVVSGINYGENIGTCVTVSGTIGAALEAAEHGIPSLAVSLELLEPDYHTHDRSVDFGAALHFVRLFAARALAHPLPPDVDVLKIEVPASATPETPWRVTRQDRLVYYRPRLLERPDPFNGPGRVQHQPSRGAYTGEDTDAYAQAQGWVSVTPLSLDLTSRVALEALRRGLE
jgi:5'-nucleotidase